MSDVVERAKAALEGVTEGPWSRHDFGLAGQDEPSSIVVFAGEFDWQAIHDGDLIVATPFWDAPNDRNARFIAAARFLVPELVAELETTRARLAALPDRRFIPDRTFIDNLGQRWEWCGGAPGTWAWRITSLGEVADV